MHYIKFCSDEGEYIIDIHKITLVCKDKNRSVSIFFGSSEKYFLFNFDTKEKQNDFFNSIVSLTNTIF